MTHCFCFVGHCVNSIHCNLAEPFGASGCIFYIGVRIPNKYIAELVLTI